jgi:hypothetical protein
MRFNWTRMSLARKRLKVLFVMIHNHADGYAENPYGSDNFIVVTREEI